MLIGYMRVSTEDQNLHLQEDALKQAGCDQIFRDIGSGSNFDRVGLSACLAFMRNGQDTLVVWKSDRLGRSLRQMIEIIESLKERKIGFKSLTEGIMDTTTSDGALLFGLFSLLAEHERSRLRERTMAGLAAARARGRKGGRPIKLTEEKQKLALTLLQSPQYSIREISGMLGLSPSTLYHFTSARKRAASTRSNGGSTI